MSMTESEAIEYLSNRYLVVGSPVNPPKEECEKHNAIMDMAIAALSEVQQYRAIGTVKVFETVIKSQMDYCNRMREYEKIGTVSEFRELKEKATAKKVDVKEWIYTKCDCGYEFSKHHGDGYYSIPYERQTNYCPNCGQRLLWT